MTVQELIECLERVPDKTAVVVFADDIPLLAIYDFGEKVIITDTISE